MKKMLKLLGVMAALAMVLGFGLTACSSGDDDDDDAKDPVVKPENPDTPEASGLPWSFDFKKLTSATWNDKKFTLGSWGTVKEDSVYAGDWSKDADGKAGLAGYLDTALMICSPGTNGTMGADSASEPTYLSWGGGYETAFNTTTIGETLDLNGQSSRSAKERYIGVDPSKIEGATGNVIVTFTWKSAGSNNSTGATGQLVVVDGTGKILAYKPVDNKNAGTEADIALTIDASQKVFLYYSRCETGGGSINITKITIAKPTNETVVDITDADLAALAELGEPTSSDPDKFTITFDSETKKATLTGVAVGTGFVKCGETKIAKVTVSEGTLTPAAVGLPKALVLDETNVNKTFGADEAFSAAGLKGTVSYWLEKPDKAVTVGEGGLVVTAPDFSAAGEKTVAVSYTEDECTLSASYKVNKSNASVTGITVDASKAKTEFNVGDKFVYDGIVVKKVWSEGEPEPVTGGYAVAVAADYVADGKLKAGKGITVTVTLGDHTATYTIDVVSIYEELASKANNIIKETFEAAPTLADFSECGGVAAGMYLDASNKGYTYNTEDKNLTVGNPDASTKNGKLIVDFGLVTGEVEGYLEVSMTGTQLQTKKAIVTLLTGAGKSSEEEIFSIFYMKGENLAYAKNSKTSSNEIANPITGNAGNVKGESYKIYYKFTPDGANGKLFLKINGTTIFEALEISGVNEISGMRIESHNGGKGLPTVDNIAVVAALMTADEYKTKLTAKATALTTAYAGPTYTEFTSSATDLAGLKSDYANWEGTAKTAYMDYVKAQIDAEVTAAKLAEANTGKTFASSGATTEITAFIADQKGKVKDFKTAKSTLEGLAAAITAAVTDGTIHDDTYHSKPEVNVIVKIKDGDSVLTTDTEKLAKLKGKGGDTIAYADIVAAVDTTKLGDNKVVDKVWEDEACSATEITSTAGYKIADDASADVTIYVTVKDKPSEVTFTVEIKSDAATNAATTTTSYDCSGCSVTAVTKWGNTNSWYTDNATSKKYAKIASDDSFLTIKPDTGSEFKVGDKIVFDCYVKKGGGFKIATSTEKVGGAIPYGSSVVGPESIGDTFTVTTLELTLAAGDILADGSINIARTSPNTQFHGLTITGNR